MIRIMKPSPLHINICLLCFVSQKHIRFVIDLWFRGPVLFSFGWKLGLNYSVSPQNILSFIRCDWFRLRLKLTNFLESDGSAGIGNVMKAIDRCCGVFVKYSREYELYVGTIKRKV